MEAEADDILGLLPLVGGSWPPGVEEILQSIKDLFPGGGDSLFRTILKMREQVAPGEYLAEDAGLGFALYLDDLLSPDDRRRWFKETLPSLAGLLLDLPSLLSAHFRLSPRHLRLRILPAQRPGAVLLSQRLVAALVACSFLCLFPVRRRRTLRLPPIVNMDSLFHSMYQSGSPALQHKFHCLLHYFRRASASSSSGAVSFHRKVVPSPAPPPLFWAQSARPLCAFEVHTRGFIEDHPVEALQVDFANQYLGGGALNRGCVQEEIRFMINPELIAGMIFLPEMQDNEAIEIVGVERFSNYTGYASSFRFAGDHVDATEVDSSNRRRTRIIAIDALCNPGMRQYKLDFILRETNKAFCGFSDQIESEHFQKLVSCTGPQQALWGHSDQHGNHVGASTTCGCKSDENPSTCVAIGREDEESTSRVVDDTIGIATGNWGCGAFGGDPELKAMIQWLAAAQAMRPVMAYYTFGIKELRNLEQVSHWILLHKWTVGDLWNILVEYSSQRHKGEAMTGFFAWLLPFLSSSHETPNSFVTCDLIS